MWRAKDFCHSFILHNFLPLLLINVVQRGFFQLIESMKAGV